MTPTRITHLMRQTLLPGLAIALLAACGSKDTPPIKDKADSGVEEGADMDAEALVDEEEDESLDKIEVADIEPEFTEFGPRDMIPDQVIIRSAVNLASSTGVRIDPDQTRVTFEPDVEGELRRRTRDSLLFRPTYGFKPGQTYKVKLETIEVGGRTLTPDEPWSYEFKTPKFELLAMTSPVRIDAQTVEVSLQFSAPPKDKDLSEFAKFTYKGAPIKSVTYMSGGRKNIVRAKLVDARFGKKGDGELSLAMAAGVPFNEDIKAASASFVSKIVSGPELDIIAASKSEGTSGFYIQVYCDDDAVPGNKRYYYDRTTYDDYYVSSKCLPDADSAKRKISFNPKVDFEISPSGGGFRIFGDFKKGAYSMRIEPGMVTTAGGVSRTTYTKDIEIPLRASTINFTTKGRYIPREAWTQMSFKHLNVKEASVKIRHIPYKNIPFWLSGGSEQADARVANVVYKEDMKLSAKEDQEATSWIDLRTILPEPTPGVYELEISDKRGKVDESRLLITDLNIVAKRSAKAAGDKWSNEVYVWAFGMRDIKPRSGVKIKTIRPSGKVMATCTTDSRGGCILNLSQDDVDDAAPFAIIANQGEDFTYLKYSELATESTGGATYGEPYLSEKKYRSMLYGDRDLYRPGDAGHFVGIVRANSNYQAPRKGLPVELTLRDSRSRLVKREIVKTNAAGAVALDYDFADFAPTGGWRMELKIGKKVIASYPFNVEEFVPERMRVKAKFEKEDTEVGEPMNVEVEAKYLFGGSAAGSRVDARCWLEPAAFSPEHNKDYDFNTLPEFTKAKRVELGAATEYVGEDDSVNIECPTSDEAEAFAVTGDIVSRVSVMEAGSGRATVKTTRAKVHPERHYVGLKAQVKKAQAGKAFKVQGVVVDWDGVAVNTVSEVKIELVRMISEYGWYYDEDEGYDRYQWYRRPVREGLQTVQVGPDGKFELELTPREDGSAFVVRAIADGARAEFEVPGSHRYYYWYSRDSSVDYTPSPEKPAFVKIDMADELELGKVADVTFDAPFKGRALITVETHRVVEQHWMDVEPGPNKWSFTPKEFVPNLYVSVMVVKDPHLDSKDAFLPGRGQGVQSAKILSNTYQQDVVIKAPKEIESESKLKVTLELGPQKEETWATVAAVDEGILQLTNYKTPDPNKSIFARRALGVDTFDTVGWALQLESMRGKEGGGDDYDEEEAMDGEQSKGLNRPKAIKPVALWSGLVKVPASGKLDVEFDVPLYRGSLRVMAITTSATRVGRAEKEVLVRDPITIQSTLPRFLTRGDEAHIPVFVTNMSGKKRDIRVVFEAEEQALEGISTAKLGDAKLVELISAPTETLTLEDGASGTAIFRVKGLRSAGIAKFRVIASDGKLASKDEAIVPFIPDGPAERMVQRVEVEAGSNDMSKYLAGWEPTSERTTFWLTPLPYGEAFDHLKYLVKYPYGCIEQTTSSTRPLLFVGQILEQVAPDIAPEQEKLDKMVKHGINRVLSMQTTSGGFAYWPGGRYPNAWGTAYASHMLLDARDKGYEVPAKRLNQALDWLEESVGRDTYPYAEPYMHYVLARSKRGQKGRIKQLLKILPKEPTGEKAEQVYLLQAALYLMGDHRYESALKQPDVSALNTERRYGYSYYSDKRRRAMVLATFHDLFGKDNDGEQLAQLVGRSLSESPSYYYTTQELVWGITALGKWIEGTTATFEGAELVVNGDKLAPMKKSNKRPDITWSLMRASEYQSVKLDLRSKDKGTLYMVVSSEGVRTNPTVKFGGEGFSIKQEYFNGDGDPLDKSNIELGELIYARITLENKSGEKVENVALVERFPAGWEIENPNLGRGSLPAFLTTNMWGKDHMNQRDDRVEVFGTLYRGQKVSVVVALRATSAGSFKIPASYAEAMYDPTKWARVDGERVTVIGPWED